MILFYVFFNNLTIPTSGKIPVFDVFYRISFFGNIIFQSPINIMIVLFKKHVKQMMFG